MELQIFYCCLTNMFISAELLRQQGIKQLTVYRQFTQTCAVSIVGHLLCCKDSIKDRRDQIQHQSLEILTQKRTLCIIYAVLRK